MGAYGSPEFEIPRRPPEGARPKPRKPGFACGVLAGSCLVGVLEVVGLLVLGLVTYHQAHP